LTDQLHLSVIASLDTWKTATDLAANLFTIGAIIIGGVWAYFRFARERTRWPRAELQLVLIHRRLTEGESLLSAKVKVHNSGSGLMKLEELRLYIHRVLPPGDETRQKIESGTLIQSGDAAGEANWPCIEPFKRTWSGDMRPEIEPQENDEFPYDFVVPSDLETVFVYAYLQNTNKRTKKGELGWSVTAFYDLAAAADMQVSENIVSGAAP
jgi:hypothetical protein